MAAKTPQGAVVGEGKNENARCGKLTVHKEAEITLGTRSKQRGRPRPQSVNLAKERKKMRDALLDLEPSTTRNARNYSNPEDFLSRSRERSERRRRKLKKRESRLRKTQSVCLGSTSNTDVPGTSSERAESVGR